jgi:hypothetical protein
MNLLKQSTAATIYVGPIQNTSGTPITNAVVGDFRIVKNGTAATLSGATVTHDVNGHYTIALTTTNTDTKGRLTIASGNTAHTMPTHSYSVVASETFNALITNDITSAVVRVSGDQFGNTLSIPSLATKSTVPALRSATAQAGGANSITLDSFSSDVTDLFANMVILLTSGTGEGQTRTISTYNGTTKVATVSAPWTVTPDGSTTFTIVPAGSSSGGSGDASQATLLAVKAKTDLIGAGAVLTSAPVDYSGVIKTPIVIGDDYLASNGRAFEWTIDAIPGFNVATTTTTFGGKNAAGLGWLVSGTVSDIGAGKWKVSHDMPAASTSTLSAGFYEFSVELKNGAEITRVRSGANRVAVVEKQT